MWSRAQAPWEGFNCIRKRGIFRTRGKGKRVQKLRQGAPGHEKSTVYSLKCGTPARKRQKKSLDHAKKNTLLGDEKKESE